MVFKNSAGQTFELNHLSSGEKQLFVRALSLRMLSANNSIILVDEPEISMHPNWQQRIMRVYENIGQSNQVIAATHSPHVVSSVKKESLKLLKRQNGKIEITGYKEMNGSYGLPVDIVLQELMALSNTRDPGVAGEIRKLWDMVHNNEFFIVLTEENPEDYLTYSPNGDIRAINNSQKARETIDILNLNAPTLREIRKALFKKLLSLRHSIALEDFEKYFNDLYNILNKY